ncbi:hypothetical protein AgCh_006499 [Apium graveolens]
MSKNKGGLGFRDLHDFNLALLEVNTFKIATVVWDVWWVRNKRVWEWKVISPEHVNKWVTPSVETLKMNVDALVFDGANSFFVGLVARNHQGNQLGYTKSAGDGRLTKLNVDLYLEIELGSRNLIFRFLQSKARIQIWLFEQKDLRIEGRIIGFDEYMNLVLDDAEEVSIKKKSRKPLGRILLKGDNITLMMNTGK